MPVPFLNFLYLLNFLHFPKPLFLLFGVLECLLFRRGLLVFLREALNAAGRIQQLLFAGEERMAVGADFDAQELALHG